MKYIYEDHHQPVDILTQTPSNIQSSIQQELSQLDTAWLIQLHLAARGADEEAISHLLEQIQDRHPTIASVIQDLVNNFHLEQIVSLVKPFINPSTNDS